jgi:hypothetical protein
MDCLLFSLVGKRKQIKQLSAISFFAIRLLTKLFVDWLEGRKRLGLPEDWSIVESWLNERRNLHFQQEEVEEQISAKWDLPRLSNYYEKADDDFWANFPKKDLSDGPKTVVNFGMAWHSNVLSCH